MSKDIAVIVGIYFTILIGWCLFGFIKSLKKGGNTADSAYVGDRSYGTAPIVATVVACWASHYTLLAASESGFLHGISGPIWYAFAVILPMFFFVWPINLVERIRNKLPNGVTIVEYIGKRYDGKTQAVSLVVVLLSSVLYVISTIMATGIFLTALLNIDLGVATLIGGVVLIIYTSLGGFGSLIWSHVFQLVLAGASIFITLIMVIMNVGISDFISNIPTEKLNSFGWGPVGMLDFFLGLLAFTIAHPVIWQRIFSARDSKSASRALMWYAPAFAPFAIGAGILGMVAFSVMPGIDPSQSATLLVVDLLPTWGAVVFLLGSMALIFSSGDSAINNIASIIELDVIKKYFKKTFTSKQNLFLSFGLQLTLGVIGVIGALSVSSALDLLVVNGLVNVALLFPLYLGITWKNAHSDGAFWSILITLIVGVIALNYGAVANLVTVIISLIIFLAISYISNNKSPTLDKSDKRLPKVVKGMILVVAIYCVVFFAGYISDPPVLTLPDITMYPLLVIGLIGTLFIAIVLPIAIIKDNKVKKKLKKNLTTESRKAN